jgi:hypothetical protein
MLPTNTAQVFALAGTVFVYLGGMADLCCSSVAAGRHTCSALRSSGFQLLRFMFRNGGPRFVVRCFPC